MNKQGGLFAVLFILFLLFLLGLACVIIFNSGVLEEITVMDLNTFKRKIYEIQNIAERR